jgi:hypothetical protein
MRKAVIAVIFINRLKKSMNVEISKKELSSGLKTIFEG